MTRKFAEQLAANFPLLSDPQRHAASAYGVVGPGQPFASRWTFYIGADGRILYIDKQVSAPTHGKAIVLKLAELGIPKRKRAAR